VSTQRAVLLANPDDPLAIDSIVDTTTVNGKDFVRSYDAANRRFSLRTPEGRERRIDVDAKGRPILLNAPAIAPVDFGYDGLGRVTTIGRGTGQERRALTLDYNDQGWVSKVTDSLSRSVQFEYDEAGRVLRQTGPDGKVLSFLYDHDGNLTSITPPGRPAHVFGFNAVDLLGSYEPPAGGAQAGQTYNYNLDQQPAAITRAGSPIGFAYDAGGRVERLSFSRGEIGLAYDPATGKLKSLTAPGGEVVSYSYDGFLNTSMTWSGPVAGSVQRVYDNDFHLISSSINGINPVSYSYDRDGLLIQAGSLVIARDPANGLLTGTTLGQLTTTQGYNSFGEITDHGASFGSQPLYSATYSRDKIGRIVQKAETIDNATKTLDYRYDDDDRLTDVLTAGTVVQHFDYDDNGNRVSAVDSSGPLVATYDDQDRVVTYGDVAYSYSAGGELSSLSQNGQTLSYDYDELGNLRQVVTADGITISYVIDGQNRRVGKRVNGTLVQGFLYRDQMSPVAELDGAGNVVARFAYGSSPHTPDFMVKGGVTYRILSDHLGSPRLVVNSETGEALQRLDYDAFGRVVLDTNPGFQPFGFAGGLYDRQIGLVRFGARDYDPRTGRWTAKDRLLFRGGEANLYSYVGNDPVNFVDPWGEMKLPANPSGLGPEWTRDTGHLHPGGERYIGPGGDMLDFHRGRPGEPGAQGEDHWHHYPKGGGKRHRPLDPGTDIPDPEPDSGPTCRVQSNQGEPSSPYGFDIPQVDPHAVAVGVGVGIIVGTIIEDFATGGVGILDDPETIGFGLSLIAGGAH
jgi:RHS repeat-associated protein